MTQSSGHIETALETFTALVFADVCREVPMSAFGIVKKDKKICEYSFVERSICICL